MYMVWVYFNKFYDILKERRHVYQCLGKGLSAKSRSREPETLEAHTKVAHGCAPVCLASPDIYWTNSDDDLAALMAEIGVSCHPLAVAASAIFKWLQPFFATDRLQVYVSRQNVARHTCDFLVRQHHDRKLAAS